MWMCERCTWINRDSSNQCEKCGVKPTAAVEAPKAQKRVAAASQKSSQAAGSDDIAQPKFRRDDPLLRVQKQVLRQVELHVEEQGHDEEKDEHIAWDSAGNLGAAVRGIAQKKRAEGAASINPAGSVADIPQIPMPTAKPSNTLPITLSIAVAGLLFVIAVIAFIVNDRLSDTSMVDSPYDSTQTTGGLFSHRLAPSALDGLWLGTDHSASGQGGSGTPVKYIFSSPDFLMVVGANSSDTDTTMAESSYRFDGKTLATQIISSSTSLNGGPPSMAPTSAASTLRRDALTLNEGASTLILQRPQDIVGTWTASNASGAATTFTFGTSNAMNWSGATFAGWSAAGSGSYSLSGNTVLTGAAKAPAQTPSLTFTFDGGDLVLYSHQATTSSSPPLHLKRQ